MSFSGLEIVFFLLLLSEWYIHPTSPIPQSQKEKGTVFWEGFVGKEDSILSKLLTVKFR